MFQPAGGGRLGTEAKKRPKSNFTAPAACVTLTDMYKAKKLLPLLFMGVLLAGCNGTITNLTPRVEFRNSDNLYPVEAKFTTSQQTVRWENVKATAVVGSDMYPMRNTQLMTNRW